MESEVQRVKHDISKNLHQLQFISIVDISNNALVN